MVSRKINLETKNVSYLIDPNVKTGNKALDVFNASFTIRILGIVTYLFSYYGTRALEEL